MGDRIPPLIMTENVEERVKPLISSLNLSPSNITWVGTSPARMDPIRLDFDHEVDITHLVPHTSTSITTKTNEMILLEYSPWVYVVGSEHAKAILTWLATFKVPVPTVLHHRPFSGDTLDQEFVLTTMPPGKNLNTIYRSFTKEQTIKMVDNIVDLVITVNNLPAFSKISGLRMFHNDITEGPLSYSPLIDNHYDLLKEVTASPHTTDRFLEAVRKSTGPFDTYAEFITAYIKSHTRFMENDAKWSQMLIMKDTLPRIEKFLETLPSYSEEINKEMKLHIYNPHLVSMDNIMVDPNTLDITGVLYWDFAGTYPIRENWCQTPVHSTLSAEIVPVSPEFLQIFIDRCEKKGIVVSSEKDMYVGSQLRMLDKTFRLTRLIRLFVESIMQNRPEVLASEPQREKWKEEMQQILTELNL